MCAAKHSQPRIPTDNHQALTHNPFAALKDVVPTASVVPSQAESADPDPKAPPSPPTVLTFPNRIHLREESKGRAGKTVTRISGLSRETRTAVAPRLCKAFGCGSTEEGEDLLLLGSVEARAARWFEDAGAKDVTTARPRAPREMPREPKPVPTSIKDPTRRAAVQRGLRVAVVLKEDQPTGALTEGIVQDILTNSAQHPRGIKVRLESGQVGRIHHFLE